MPFAFSVVTPERSLVQVDADHAVLPGEEGEFGVLPQHEAFLAPLRAGVVRFAVAGERQELRIGGGFAEVSQDRVTVLADSE